MRVIFMGTPEFSVPVLDELVRDHDVVCAYSQPPRPAGRGKKLRPSPVQARAEALGIEVRHPTSLKSDEAQQAFADLRADVAVVVAYGLILPQAILDAPRLGCINVHASLLPRWRGAAPIHRAIMSGDVRTGVCIMQMDAGLDTGPVLMREGTDIGASETTGDLHDRLSRMGARLIGRVLPQLEHLSPVAQPSEGVTYADKIDKAEAAMDWTRDATALARHINGLSPFPGAFVTRVGARLKLLRAEVADGQAVPGVLSGDEGLMIGTEDGLVNLLEVQPAGKGRMDAADWRRGAQPIVGEPFADAD